MAADPTYQPLVYKNQGSTELVVASSGLITIEDGGSMDVESGGGIDIQSGGDITVESGGAIVFPASGATSSAVGSTTLTEFANCGVSFVCSAGDVRKFEIADPTLGAMKFLFQSAGSTAMCYYFSAGDAGFVTTSGASTAHLLINEGTTSGAQSAWCLLFGLSTSRWLVGPKVPSSQWVIASTSS